AVDEAQEMATSARLARDRAESLFNEGIISESSRESADSTWRVAESTLRSANATFDAGRQNVRSAEKSLQLSAQQAEVIRREQERQSESQTSQIELLKAQEIRLSLEQKKLAEGLERLEIRSPVDGTVTTVTIRNEGEFAQLGLTLATVAPADAPWIVESWVTNRDAGALRENLGAEVNIKFDAFPFRDYGYVRGTLEEISPDSQLVPLIGDAFRVRISLESLEIGRAGRRGEVRLGMTVTADIVKEKERVLLLLFRKVRDRISYE
ncbi:MAG: HlyD family efflux transporter periplasmic adaptor subunit, partial [Acidobacteriota bacterium]